MNLSAFKAYDIRGAYPSEVNEDLAYLIGRAVVSYFKAKTVVIGYDMRKSSPSLVKSLAEGLICQGSNVVDIGMCTTPMLNFAVAKYVFDGGVMVSASHNPSSDNAFKIIDKDVIQLDENNGLPDIKNLIQTNLGECVSSVGSITKKNILNDYLDHLSDKIGGLKPIKLVVDYGNGVGSISGSAAFKKFGLEPIELFAGPDGDFPNHPANPHDISNFDDLIFKVVDTNSSLGIFFDGDADRANFVDDMGRIVPVDLLTILLAQDELVVKKSGNVFYDLRFSKATPEFIKQSGGNPVMMRVGNPYYKQALKDQGGIIGSEFAGHIMFPENFNIDDGIFTALKVIKMIENRSKSLSELIDSITVFADSPEQSMTAKNPTTVYQRLISAFPDGKQIDLDGVYLDFPDGFISVRQSQNELQLFRIRVEAKDVQTMQSRFDQVKTIVVEG